MDIQICVLHLGNYNIDYLAGYDYHLSDSFAL